MARYCLQGERSKNPRCFVNGKAPDINCVLFVQTIEGYIFLEVTCTEEAVELGMIQMHLWLTALTHHTRAEIH